MEFKNSAMATLPRPGETLLLLGPMFCGKTQTLMYLAHEAGHGGKATWVIKHRLDDRHGADFIGTHDGHKMRADGMASLMTGTRGGSGCVRDPLAYLDYLFIDEAHFFADLREFVDTVHATYPRLGIIIAALEHDYLGNTWLGIDRCLRKGGPDMAVLRLQGVCERCAEPATMTKLRFTALYDGTGGTVLVGGADKYMPVCMACFKD